ncbi:MAG TPA: DUF6600 domain-containing protein, partial [Polyangia bacterium]|nr:DUF6600 domain-containing protein [Polyangia bacterium]
MKSSIFVSVFGVAALLGLPAGAQTAGPQMPAPYAPPPQVQQMPGAQPPPAAPAVVPEAGPSDGQDVQGELPLPTGDASGVPPDGQVPPYDAGAAANYPPPDLGPDNDIAQGYDDGYDEQAYTQFQSALAPYGAWDYDADYGYVWSPGLAIVGAGFCPYATHGRWVFSEYGWTWVSDWSWGWAPFHYGRWITRAGRWSWVPGTMWGPAWVSWRSGGGYVGWAPLPPRGVRLTAGIGGGSPWRFTAAARLGAAHPSFVSSRYLPGMFAHTTVVSTDRLLTHGRWTVHVNAGPTRGINPVPTPLSRIAPKVLPRVAVYPHAGMELSARPWIRAAAMRNDALAHGWHDGAPAPQPRTMGRAPAHDSSGAARAEIRAPSAGWAARPAQRYGSAGSYGHPYGSGWSAPATRPSYGAPRTYGAAPPTYRAPAPAPTYPAPA